jgi:hypothetical protein
MAKWPGNDGKSHCVGQARQNPIIVVLADLPGHPPARASAACAPVCSDCVCLENVAKGRYLDWTQGFAMKAARYMTKAITGKATGRLFWRWPLAFGLALAVAISLFHDLPAFAGTGDASSTPLAVASSTSAPVQAPESQSPGHGCHCLCHITAQAIASPVVTPVVFDEPLYLPPQGVPTRSRAGLPPFRPPRV